MSNGNSRSFSNRGNALLEEITRLVTEINGLIETYRTGEPNQSQITRLGESVRNLLNNIRTIQNDFKRRVTELLRGLNSFPNNRYIKKGAFGRAYVLSVIPPIMQMDDLVRRLQQATSNKEARNAAAANAARTVRDAANANKRKTAARTALSRLLNQVKGAKRNVNGSGSGNGAGPSTTPAQVRNSAILQAIFADKQLVNKLVSELGQNRDQLFAKYVLPASANFSTTNVNRVIQTLSTNQINRNKLQSILSSVGERISS